MLEFNSKCFLLTIALLATELMIGLYMHDAIIRPYGGDFLVVILIYCFVKSFLAIPVKLTALYVLIYSYAVEISQYFHLIKLLGLEKSTIARLILGTTFAWTDMIMYTLGILMVIWVEGTFNNK